jgi:hypothetical protein
MALTPAGRLVLAFTLSQGEPVLAAYAFLPMRHWLVQITLVTGILLFVSQLPSLGSPVTALWASCLAVATVGAMCAVIDHVAGPRHSEQPA